MPDFRDDQLQRRDDEPECEDGAMDLTVLIAAETDDEEPEIPPKLYRIGEVAEHYGCSRQTIHNYTIMGLIDEAGWTRGGHRQYDESVFERIDLIQKLRAQQVPLERIREHFTRMEI
jgi:hypothetical protein